MPSLTRRFGCRATALTFSVLAVLVLAAIAIANPQLAETLTAEDGVVEWLQVVLMAGAAALAARHGWLAQRAGRPAVLEVAIVTTMVMILVGELDLDRAIVGTKVISTRFFVNPKYPLAWRALAVLVIVGLPVGVGLWLLARWRQLIDAALEGLRQPWGQAAAVGIALYGLTEVFERPLDYIHVPWQPRYLLEETLELVSAIWLFAGLAARPGLGLRARRGSNFGETRIIEGWLARVPPRHRFYVDIAAGDGETMSNTLGLARAGWDGLAVEADPALFDRLRRSYRSHPRVRLAQTVVTPDNVVDLLRAHGVPRDFGVLSLDIDGYDHFVLSRLLEAFRPGLVCAEINEAIPPPVKFAVTYRPDHAWAKDHFYGQSLAMLDELRARHGYALVQVEYNNAFLLPEECSPVATRPVAEVYREGYLARPDRLRRLPWNREVEFLQALPPEDVVAALHVRFARYAGRYVCTV